MSEELCGLAIVITGLLDWPVASENSPEKSFPSIYRKQKGAVSSRNGRGRLNLFLGRRFYGEQ